ncbi:toxic anion resistance protein [Virgibacillus sp. MSP4-1]|uniref:toxic anion resistance protein n=1 Tax=Virgibacillus sp. MSP4-1 TaxID=2700081 RepID=UPI0003AB28FA|nr:toxic anion resistance protein [Virgibacillus sp. MSP4-1]QHS21468.1 toxic anion resistance protein [Virgibacillus sp. MSP4-1]
MDNKNETIHKDDGNLMDELLANPFGNEESTDNEMKEAEEGSRKLVDVLPEEDKEKAQTLATQIDVRDHEAIISYGTQAQSKLLDFSHSMLEHVQKKDTGEVGQVISDLMKKFNEMDPDDLRPEKQNVIKRIFGKLRSSVQEIVSKYQKTGAQIDRISVKLENNKDGLLSDIAMLEKLYEHNKEYFKGLNVYIAAGELKLEEVREKEIPALRKAAESTDDQMKYQEVNDLIQFAERLEKRIHDLKLSRQITIQSAPQIRLIQNTNQVLVEKIQSSILTAIPLWKNQIAIALTMFRQKNAVEAQKQVSKTTNDLLLKNSEMLKTNTVETAKLNEQGLVDIDTLKQTQDNLVSTLEEVLEIQDDGRRKRLEAEQEIGTMEQELKQKLLHLKDGED